MSEPNDSLIARDVAVPAATEVAASAGQLLRAARERAGLHIAALAVSLKVPVKRVEALEADQWDVFPDTIFARALASSVCRALKIDAAPILDRLPKAHSSSGLSDDRGINAPLTTPGFSVGNSIFDQLSKPVVLVGLALLIGALVLIFFPSMDHFEEMIVTPSQKVFAPASVTDPVAVPLAESVVLKEKTSIQNDQAQTMAMSSSEAVSSPPGQGDGGVRAAPVVMEPLSGAQLVFKSRGSSWVEVTDAKGTLQLRKILETGDSVEVAGVLPLSVVVGRADVIDIQFRGKPFDLQAVTKSNVARFEVK
jgi:cytoskeleton protein RodZ